MTHALAGGGTCSGDFGIFGIGDQFTDAPADLPQHLSFDERDDFGGPLISDGGAFFANLSMNLSEISLQERENNHSVRSLNVEGTGGMSTALSETPSGDNPNPLQNLKPTLNTTHSITLPKPSRYAFKAFFIEHAIILGIFLVVIIPAAAGAISGILKENLIIGIIVGLVFFLLNVIVFASLQVLWREAKEAEQLKSSAVDEAEVNVEPPKMV